MLLSSILKNTFNPYDSLGIEMERNAEGPNLKRGNAPLPEIFCAIDL